MGVIDQSFNPIPSNRMPVPLPAAPHIHNRPAYHTYAELADVGAVEPVHGARHGPLQTLLGPRHFCGLCCCLRACGGSIESRLCERRQRGGGGAWKTLASRALADDDSVCGGRRVRERAPMLVGQMREARSFLWEASTEVSIPVRSVFFWILLALGFLLLSLAGGPPRWVSFFPLVIGAAASWIQRVACVGLCNQCCARAKSAPPCSCPLAASLFLFYLMESPRAEGATTGKGCCQARLNGRFEDWPRQPTARGHAHPPPASATAAAAAVAARRSRLRRGGGFFLTPVCVVEPAPPPPQELEQREQNGQSSRVVGQWGGGGSQPRAAIRGALVSAC